MPREAQHHFSSQVKINCRQNLITYNHHNIFLVPTRFQFLITEMNACGEMLPSWCAVEWAGCISVFEHAILYKTTITVHVSQLPVNLLVILALADFFQIQCILICNNIYYVNYYYRDCTRSTNIIVFRCHFTAMFFSKSGRVGHVSWRIRKADEHSTCILQRCRPHEREAEDKWG